MMISDYTIAPEVSLKEALKRLDHAGSGILFVVDPCGMLVGALSDGDARRAILAGTGLEASIDGIFNRRPHSMRAGAVDRPQARELFLARRIKVIPLVDAEHRLSEVLTWERFFDTEGELPPAPGPGCDSPLAIPVVIMAGGKGTRMAPFTNVLPKPLIPIGERTILELINYRGEMIRAYLDSIEKDYSIDYVFEKEFCGTAGSIGMLRDRLEGDFIVSNCDIIVKANYADVYAFHRENRAAMTVVSAIQHHAIPYGVIDFVCGGRITSIREKPEYTVNINTGVYILSHECLDLIPDGEFFHMTHLIEKLLVRGDTVLTYPVNEHDYIDIGQWSEYHNAIGRMQRLT
jgi:dTDP-glucose pyrophosphorylase